jgi:hypothetical protein
MFLIIEIAMFIGGIWALVKGEVPSFLVGGGKYKVEGTNARVFGLLLILPLPIAFLGGLILGLLFGQDGVEYATILELVAVIGIAILSLVLVRIMGKQVVHVSDTEATIAKKAQGALFYAIFSGTGFATIICCPLAYIYANQALKLIEEHGIGEQYKSKAKTARGLALGFTSLWVVAILCVIFVV